MKRRKLLKLGVLLALVLVCVSLLSNTDNLVNDFFRGLIDGFYSVENK